MAFRVQGGVEKIDAGTPLTGRVRMGEDFSLTISSCQPSDELVLCCQVSAGTGGVSDATTMLKVFCESATALTHTDTDTLSHPLVDVWSNLSPSLGLML